MTPVVGLMLSPAGSPVACHVNGPEPLPATVELYGAPAVLEVSEVVVIVGGPATTNVNVAIVFSPFASVNVMVTG